MRSLLIVLLCYCLFFINDCSVSYKKPGYDFRAVKPAFSFTFNRQLAK